MAAAQVPCSLQLEPMMLATGFAVDLTAGAAITETGITVLSGTGQRMVRGLIAGEKASFAVVQRLWRVEAAPATGAHAHIPAGCAAPSLSLRLACC